jgi:hypothetical protein
VSPLFLPARDPIPRAANLSNLSSNPNDFVAAYFEKYGITDASKAQNLPSSWRWQRRFFIFSDSQRMMYYFKVWGLMATSDGEQGISPSSVCMQTLVPPL